MGLLSRLIFWGVGDKKPDYVYALERADKARDSKDWSAAIGDYKIYLQSVPHDAAICIQLGHCLKEVQNYGDARIFYDKAYAINPNDDDLLLQIGHLEKISGNKAQALQWYERSVQLNKHNVHAATEVEALRNEFSRDANTDNGDPVINVSENTHNEVQTVQVELSTAERIIDQALTYKENSLLSRHVPVFSDDVLTSSQRDVSNRVLSIVEKLEIVR